MNTLIVEDKKQLADAIAEYLRLHKIDATVRLDGAIGYDEARKGIYDVIVLDLMLPSKDGLSIIKDLRKIGNETPIIVLTAKTATDDKVECLLSGANDYLTKPFVLDELLARLYVLTRKRGQTVSNVLEFGDIKLDKANHTLCKGDEAISLSVKEFSILEILIENKDRIVEKSFILEKVWGNDANTYYNSSEVYVSFLRKKLASIESSVTVKSVRNVGYKIVDKN